MAAFSAKPYSKVDYISIGRMYGSHNVELESSEVVGRWTRDVEILTDYGHGPTALEAFKALRAKHLGLMEARPDSVAAKRNVVAAKDADYRKAQVWLDQSSCILKQIAQRNEQFSMRFYEAMPDKEVGELPARIGAFKTLLSDAKALAPEDPTIDARIAEADGIVEKLNAAPGTVTTAKAAKVGDTAELDYLDGQLVVAIRNLNEAAGKAIRNGTLSAQLSEYRLNHLRRSRRPTEDDTTATITPLDNDY